MGMANLPAVREPAIPEDAAFSVAEYAAKGHRPADVAAKVHPTDKKKRRALRLKLHRLARSDADFQRAFGEAARAELLWALPAAAHALGRRAARGNPRAITLLLEATGFHNPRVKHDHSGEITVKVEGMPRPQPVEAVTDEVVDAEVVD